MFCLATAIAKNNQINKHCLDDERQALRGMCPYDPNPQTGYAILS